MRGVFIENRFEGDPVLWAFSRSSVVIPQVPTICKGCCRNKTTIAAASFSNGT
jgi:hypothetical protein